MTTTTKNKAIKDSKPKPRAPSLKSLGFTPDSGPNRSLNMAMNLAKAHAVYEVLSGIGKDAKSSYETDEQLYLALERIKKFLEANGVKL
jgi:hypothetical protein